MTYLQEVYKEFKSSMMNKLKAISDEVVHNVLWAALIVACANITFVAGFGWYLLMGIIIGP